MEVFLGGTANNTTWRDYVIQFLKMNYFNPIVENWNEKAKQKEIEKRSTCDWLLYVITPKMHGVYSIAEAVKDACERPHKTIFCVITNDDNNEFTEHQLSSLESTKKLINDSGARVLNDLDEVIMFLNYVHEKNIKF